MQNFINNLKHKTVEELSQLMLTYAENGDLNTVKLLLTNPEIDNHADITYKDYWVLTKACSSGNLRLVKYLLTSTELKEHADINADNDLAFIAACRHGHLKVVKYLLTSTDLQKHSNVNTKKDDYNNLNALEWACHNNHLEIVKYLIGSSDLKEHINLYLNGINALKSASLGGNLEIVKYLIALPEFKKPVIGNTNSKGNPFLDYALSPACLIDDIDIVKFLLESPELIEHADVHANNDLAFKNAYEHNSLEVLKYFIFDLNIKKTEHIEKFIKNDPNPEIEKMFTIRDLNTELDSELNKQEDNKNRTIKL